MMQPVFFVSDNTRIWILNILYTLPFALKDLLPGIKLITKFSVWQLGILGFGGK